MTWSTSPRTRRRGRRLRPGVALAAAATAAALACPTAALAETAGPARPAAAPVRVAVASVAFTSEQHGWVLGSAPCAGGRCTVLASTTTAGVHWTRVAPPAARLAPSGGPGVDEVHFADDRNGWAFAPQLHVTHDGARTWQRLPVPGRGTQVVALTSAGGVAYAVVSSCVVGDPSVCPRPAQLWRSTAGGDTWTRTTLALPARGTATVTAADRTAYVVLADAGTGAQVFQATTDGGRHWAARPSPCDASAGEVLQVAAASATDAALLCSTDVQAGFYTKRVFWTTDSARTSTRRGNAPTPDAPTGLATNGRAVVIAGAGGSSALYRSADRGRTWTTPYERDPAGMSDLALVGTTGAVVRGTAALPGGAAQLLLSHDAGRSWSVAPVDLP